MELTGWIVAGVFAFVALHFWRRARAVTGARAMTDAGGTAGAWSARRRPPSAPPTPRSGDYRGISATRSLSRSRPVFTAGKRAVSGKMRGMRSATWPFLPGRCRRAPRHGRILPP